MKKRIQIIITSLLLLLLVGCDDILNSAYPSFDPEATGDFFGSNSIDATLEIDDFNIDIYNKSIKLILAPMYDGEIDFGAMWTIDYWGQAPIYNYFDMLPNNAYRIFAYQDKNDDGRPNFNEPSTELYDQNDYNQSRLFDFRFNDESESVQYSAYGYLAEYSRIEERWLLKFNEGQDVGDFIDPNYWVSGTNILNPSDLKVETFTIEQNNPDAYISAIEFTLKDSQGVEILFPGYATSVDLNNKQISIDFYNSYTFFDQGDKLRLETQVTVDTNGIVQTIPYTFYLEMDSVDLDFYIYSLNDMTLSKSGDFDGFANYDFIPNDNTLVIQSIEWRITDEYNYDVHYDNYSGFNTETSDFISLDLNLLSPSLNNNWWDYPDELIIHVYVYYTNGEESFRDFQINLID